jgi:uncharacterized cofD-like protein
VSVRAGRCAVAIGGGTGLPSVIHSLLELGFDTSAVVTMADDGGSSGMLRRQLGMLPPGDIRNCLVAMAADEDGLAARVFQYRFPHGEGLAGHALGNLILAALADLTDSFPAAIAYAENFLGARGHVYPSTLSDVELHGVDRAGVLLSGQATLAVSPEPLECVHLEPASPPAYTPALEAIRAADVIVIGPGSLYTSLIPNFLVSGIAEAVAGSSATRVYVSALIDHGLVGALDVVLVHDACAPGAALCDDVAGVESVFADASVIARIEALGPRVVAVALADPADPVRHSRAALQRTLEGVVA